MKKYLTVLLLLISIFLINCGEDIKYVPKKPDEIENFKKVEATHQNSFIDINTYILIKNKPNKNSLLTSITLQMDFIRGNKTNRFYEYFQFDYSLDNNKFYSDYHVFDNIDGQIRNYGQNFMPYYELNSPLNNFSFLIKYSYDEKDENQDNKHYEKSFTFSENIIKYTDNLYEENSFYKLNVTKTSDDKFYRYKLSLSNSITEGHIDFQSFMVLDNGDIYPFIGLYNYSYVNGNYNLVSDEKLLKEINIKEVIGIVNEYNSLGALKTYYIKGEINDKEI